MRLDEKQGRQWDRHQGEVSFIEKPEKDKKEIILQEAHYLLQKHGLSQQGWQFEFDHAKVRAGQCRYDKKVISLSRHFVEQAPFPEIQDTLLHEIAHALTPKRGHDKVWRQVALSIGCNGKRCHSLQFSKPQYIQQCINRCWRREVHRQRKNLICRFCQGKVVYVLNEQAG